MFDNKTVITNTNTNVNAEVEVDNFRENKSFDAYLANTKIPFKHNGKVYVGHMHGMEFISNGPREIQKLKGRF